MPVELPPSSSDIEPNEVLLELDRVQVLLVQVRVAKVDEVEDDGQVSELFLKDGQCVFNIVDDSSRNNVDHVECRESTVVAQSLIVLVLSEVLEES